MSAVVAEAALETVAVEQRHEELKVLFLAVVRRRRHEQEMAAEPAKLLADPVALRVFDLAPEIAGRHAMGLVADDQVPLGGLGELLLQILIAGEHVEPGDQPVAAVEGIARARGFNHVARQDVELQTEFVTELVLPLLDEVSRSDDQAALQIAPCAQLLDQQPGHDRLARPRIVGQQEAQRLTRQHLAIDGGYLMRQWIDQAGVNGEIGIEMMRERDPVRFRDQSQ